MEKRPVHTLVDGVNLNARHFTAMSKEKAVKAMVADNITKDEKWAAHAYDLMVKDVNLKDTPPKAKEEDKKAEQLPENFIAQPSLPVGAKEVAST